MKAARLIDATVTTEQAFGGDYETVSLPSALFAARYVARADVIVVAMGPGNAGTGTRLGFAGVEQGYHTDMARLMNARPVAVLRLSLADTRPRHRFLSHHSQTALGILSYGGAAVAFPAKPDGVSEANYETLRQIVNASSVAARHALQTASGAPGMALLQERSVRVSSMGRTESDDPFFSMLHRQPETLPPNYPSEGWPEMPLFLPGEPEFDTVEAAHAWMEAVLLAEYGEQDGMPETADIPVALNWFDLVPPSRRFDFETVECSMVYQSPAGDYACSVWDATGENDDPWAVFVVDTDGPRFLPEYSLMDENATDAERDAVLYRAQNEIPDRAEAGEWIRATPSGPLVIPDYLREPRPKETQE